MNEDTVTTAVAGAALTSPAWLNYLSGVSHLLLPILGALWLVVKIAATLITMRREENRTTTVAKTVSEHH